VKRLAVVLCLLAAVLVGLFLYSRWQVVEIEARYPPMGGQLELDELRLHYVDAGEGPAVVLLHGASTNLRDFTSSILTPLEEHCRVLAFDRPGHGYSTYPDQHWMSPEEQAAAVRRALRQLGIERSVWLGHSWAGAVVMAALLDFPQEVTGGVLLSGAAYEWQGGVSWTNHIVDAPGLGPVFLNALLLPAGQLLMDGKIAAAFEPNPPPTEYRDRTGVDLVLRPPQFTVNGRDVRLLSAYLERQSRRYGAIEQPLLMIHDRGDDIVPAWNHADRLLELLPQAVLSELPGSGHAPHHVEAEEVARRIARFACSA
jgi:pimeloyl-ACP methyl ester carboxylesterase